MPRKKVKLIVAAQRVAEARRIVDEQTTLIARLRAAGHPTFDAGRALGSYISALKHLENHERRMRHENRPKRRETKKPRSD